MVQQKQLIRAESDMKWLANIHISAFHLFQQTAAIHSLFPSSLKMNPRFRTHRIILSRSKQTAAFKLSATQ